MKLKGPNRACHRATLWCENIRTEQNHSRECTTRTDRKMQILFYSVWVWKVLNLMTLSWLNWRNSYLQPALTPHTIYYWCTIIACVCMIMHYGAKTVTEHHHNTFGSGAIGRTFPVIYFTGHYEGPPNITVVSVNIMDWACGLMHASIQYCKQKGGFIGYFFRPTAQRSSVRDRKSKMILTARVYTPSRAERQKSDNVAARRKQNHSLIERKWELWFCRTPSSSSSSSSSTHPASLFTAATLSPYARTYICMMSPFNLRYRTDSMSRI